MDNPSETILSNETQELQEARDAELNKVLKLKMVLNEVRNLNLGKDASNEIKMALKLISISEYRKLGDEQENVLGLQDDCDMPPLSYFDRKTVRNKLVAQLRLTHKPIADLGDKIRRELPDALSTGKDELALTNEQQNLLQLQKDQRDCLKKLAAMRRDYCELMKQTADLKMGSQLVKELRIQQAQAKLLLTKAEMLRIYFIVEAYSRSEHSLKAYKEVNKYLDELLDHKQVQTR